MAFWAIFRGFGASILPTLGVRYSKLLKGGSIGDYCRGVLSRLFREMLGVWRGVKTTDYGSYRLSPKPYIHLHTGQLGFFVEGRGCVTDYVAQRKE